MLTEPKGKKRSAAKTEGPQKRKKMKTEINSDPNALDMTAIHPESYHIADRYPELNVTASRTRP